MTATSSASSSSRPFRWRRLRIAMDGEAGASRRSFKNGLESDTYNLRNSLDDEKLEGAIRTGGFARCVGSTVSVRW